MSLMFLILVGFLFRGHGSSALVVEYWILMPEDPGSNPIGDRIFSSVSLAVIEPGIPGMFRWA